MWLEWIAVALSIVGNLFVIKRRVEGFILWSIANVLWIYIGVITSLWGMTTLFIVYFLISMYGIFSWSKKKKD